jgi:hypothetical protein
MSSAAETETVRVSVRARPFLGSEASLLPQNYDDVFVQDNLLFIRSRLEPTGYALAHLYLVPHGPTACGNSEVTIEKYVATLSGLPGKSSLDTKPSPHVYCLPFCLLLVFYIVTLLKLCQLRGKFDR